MSEKGVSAGTGFRNLLRLAGPISGVQLAQVALTSVDLAMLGLLGVLALAAGGMAILLYNQVRTMCVGMVTGVGNLIATAAGEGERRSGGSALSGGGATNGLDTQAQERIRVLLRSALVVATAVALAGCMLLCALALALPLLGQRAEVVSLARAMVFTLAGGLFPMAWLNVMRQFAVGLSRPGSLLVVTILSIGVNAALNGAFIFGWLGLPKLGIVGIGLSTSLVQVFTLVVFTASLRRDPQLRPLLALTPWRIDWRSVQAMVRHGAPISLTYGSEAAITTIATLMMGAFGPVMLAASNIANQMAYIVYQINIGISQGSSILLSRALARGDEGSARPVARRALTVSWTVTLLASLCYVLVPSLVLWPFLGSHPDPAILAVATTLLLFAIVQQWCKGTQNIFIGLLRGLGTPNWA